jgi:uncharacterized lipoprotein YajG
MVHYYVIEYIYLGNNLSNSLTGERTMKTKTIKISIIAFSIVMLAGCGNMKQMQASIDSANATASAAMSKASEAHKLASKSQSSASAAASAAANAQATANEALACCTANSDKIDRMFEKAMMK